VQVVDAVVRRELDGRSVEREPAVGDPVAVAADDSAEVAALGQIVVEVVEAEHDIVHATGAIRHPHGNDRRAVGHRADFDAAVIGEREDLDGGAAGQRAERRAGDGHRGQEYGNGQPHGEPRSSRDPQS
jgi:hypothetical protein